MLTRCPRCDQAINVMGGKRITCPRCAAKFDGASAARGIAEVPHAPARVPATNPTSKTVARLPTTGATVAVDLPRPKTSTADVPRGKPGDHRPVDRPICSFCNGRGVSLGRTCSRCRGYGYERPPLTDMTVSVPSLSEPVKTPKVPFQAKAPTVTGPGHPLPLSPESEMTPEILKEAQKLVAVGWRPFEVTPGRLFLITDTRKTKKVKFQVWSAIYRMKVVESAKATNPRSKNRSK